MKILTINMIMVILLVWSIDQPHGAHYEHDIGSQYLEHEIILTTSYVIKTIRCKPGPQIENGSKKNTPITLWVVIGDKKYIALNKVNAIHYKKRITKKGEYLIDLFPDNSAIVKQLLALEVYFDTKLPFEYTLSNVPGKQSKSVEKSVLKLIRYRSP